MSNIDGFYSSRPWFKVRAKVLKRDGYRCRMCGAAVAGPYAASVDHIIPRRLRPDLALDMSNLQTLCTVSCHNSAKKKHENNHDMKEIGLDCGEFRLPVQKMSPNSAAAFKKEVAGLKFSEFCSTLA